MLVGVAAALVGGGLALAMGSPWASAFSWIAALAVGISLAAPPAPETDAHKIVARAASHAEHGRKLVIYERETGFFAYWYLVLRGNEECNRAHRYGHPLSLLIIEPCAGADVDVVGPAVTAWLRTYLRSTDVAGYVGNARHAILMPETDAARAQATVDRLTTAIGSTDHVVVELDAATTTFETLYATAVARLPRPEAAAA